MGRRGGIVSYRRCAGQDRARGLEEMAAEPDAVVLIEWGEKFASVMERADAEVAISPLEGDERAFLVRWRD